MASRGRRKPKRKAGLGYITILLILLIFFAVIGVFVSKRFAPSKAQADLQTYYNLTARQSANRQAAADNEIAIIMDDKILDNSDSADFRAIYENGEVYAGASLIRSEIDNRFYYDSHEGLVIYTTADDSICAKLDTRTYSSYGSDHDAGYIIAKSANGTAYINLKFVAEYSGIEYQVQSNPSRVYIHAKSGSYRTATVKMDSKIRSDGSKKASVVAVAPKGDKVKVLGELEGWLKIIDEDGYMGYIQTSGVGEITTETVSYGVSHPEYTHLSLGEPVNMVWHGIYYYEGNNAVYNMTYDMTGVNVLAPTWFTFADTEGHITSYVNQDYVNYAHENGCQVWAVLEDLDGESSINIVPYTYKRRVAIDEMVSQCLAAGVDGINVDLEKITNTTGGDFIQFIRELSVECRANGLILSVDDYAPYNYNMYRHMDEQSEICDYVIVMAYDDYVGTGMAGPNAGLPFVNEVLGLCQSQVDMSRLIVGIPFYSRIWYENSDGSLDKETIDMDTVNGIIWEHGLTSQWLKDVGYDYLTYDSNGTTAKLWCENAKSLDAKLAVIKEYDVAGIAAWRLGQETSDVWAVLEQYY